MMTGIACATTMKAFFLASGAAVAAPLHDAPPVEGLEVAVAADRPSALGQDRLEVLVALAPLPGRCLLANSWLNFRRRYRRASAIPLVSIGPGPYRLDDTAGAGVASQLSFPMRS
jgi:hypothetical protein